MERKKRMEYYISDIRKRIVNDPQNFANLFLHIFPRTSENNYKIYK